MRTMCTWLQTLKIWGDKHQLNGFCVNHMSLGGFWASLGCYASPTPSPGPTIGQLCSAPPFIFLLRLTHIPKTYLFPFVTNHQPLTVSGTLQLTQVVNDPIIKITFSPHASKAQSVFTNHRSQKDHCKGQTGNKFHLHMHMERKTM